MSDFMSNVLLSMIPIILGVMILFDPSYEMFLKMSGAKQATPLERKVFAIIMIGLGLLMFISFMPVTDS